MTEPEATTLSEFPSKDMCMALVDQRNQNALQAMTRMHIGDKRSCFLALRNEQNEIHPSMVFMPLGVTVGELVVAQIIFANEKERAR